MHLSFLPSHLSLNHVLHVYYNMYIHVHVAPYTIEHEANVVSLSHENVVLSCQVLSDDAGQFLELLHVVLQEHLLVVA